MSFLFKIAFHFSILASGAFSVLWFLRKPVRWFENLFCIWSFVTIWVTSTRFNVSGNFPLIRHTFYYFFFFWSIQLILDRDWPSKFECFCDFIKSAMSFSFFTIVSSFAKIIAFLVLHLLENLGFTVFQKKFLSLTLLKYMFWKYSIFVLRKSFTQ